MPELPEVETVKLKIEPFILGKTIKSLDIFYDKYEDLKKIEGETINQIDRKGKYLIFTLDNYKVISHLRMEGKYRIKDLNYVKEKHDLVFFNFDNFRLVYNDTRKFGVFLVFDKNVDLDSVEPLVNVGKEPFSITPLELYDSLNKSHEKIKTALLNQTIMSGLGNIYADEVLYLSHIHPLRIASSISKEEAESLVKSSIEVSSKAIKAGGTTIKSFESFNNESGHFQSSLLVHLREGERCMACNNVIRKIKVNGRSSYYCPTCQKIRDYKTYALTGTYASGKSLALSMIKEKGYMTLSCDDIYKELFVTNNKMRKELMNHFHTLDKKELRDIVYSSEEENDILKEITHKYILNKIFEEAEASIESKIFIEVPILFESHLEKAFDYSICVYSNREESNFISKNVDKDIKNKVDKNQYNKEFKKAHSDYVLYNISNIENLRNNLNKLLEELK